MNNECNFEWYYIFLKNSESQFLFKAFKFCVYNIGLRISPNVHWALMGGWNPSPEVRANFKTSSYFSAVCFPLPFEWNVVRSSLSVAHNSLIYKHLLLQPIAIFAWKLPFNELLYLFKKNVLISLNSFWNHQCYDRSYAWCIICQNTIIV